MSNRMVVTIRKLTPKQARDKALMAGWYYRIIDGKDEGIEGYGYGTYREVLAALLEFAT